MRLHSPRVPLLTPFQGNLVPGSKITIVGWPLEKCKSFNIDLKLGSADEEIALTISVRFKPSVKQNVVVRNAWTSAGWGIEEKETPIFPFLTKNSYKIEIVCEKARYRILVDDGQLATFTHRLPLAHVDHLQIQGDTELSYVEILTAEFIGTPRSKVDGQDSGSFMNLSINDEDKDENN